ncbi:cell division protein FtsL [Bradyrhizobium sp. USDA 4474]
MQQGHHIWRRHLQHDQLPEATGGAIGNIERWLLALLSVVVIVICVSATIVFIQVKSLKGEIATLQREIIAFKLRLAKLDQIALANETHDKSSGTPKPPAQARPDQALLQLSREEIQLVRDYIKPAPIAGSATDAIKIGDPVLGETIPFPSQVTEKVRKLTGARFTIRNGVILITRNGSNRADVVIGPN